MSLEEIPKGKKGDSDGRKEVQQGLRLFALKWEATVTLCRDASSIWKELKLSDDALTVTGHLGYGLARCTRGFVHGCWYYEAIVNHSAEEGNCRIGWVQPKRESQLQAYPGFDEWGYSYRDKEGTYFHQARACGSGEPYGKGDVIGCLMYVPPDVLAAEKERMLMREGAKEEHDGCALKFREEFDKETQFDVAGLRTEVQGSQVIFFKNGQASNIAFTNVKHGIWFPAVGVYRQGQVTLNFGPTFQYPPKLPADLPQPRPVIDLRKVVMLSLGVEHQGLARAAKRRRCDPEVKHFLF